MSNSNQNSNKIWIIGELTRDKLEPLLESKSINKTDIYNKTISALITSIKNTTDNVYHDPPIFTEHAGYTNLSNIKVDEKNQNYTSIEGILFDKSATTLIRSPPAYPLININGLSTFQFPLINTNTNTNITKIDDYAFLMNRRIQNIDFTNLQNIQTIGKYSINACNLTDTLKLPISIITLDEACIKDNHNLKDVNWLISSASSASLLRINKLAFYNCHRLETFDFKSCPNLTIIEDNAFTACFGLQEIDIGDCISLKTIGISAFHDTTRHPDKHVKSLIFPQSIETIGNSAFENNFIISSLAFREGTDFNLLSLGADCFRDISTNLLVFKSSADISTELISQKLDPTLDLTKTTPLNTEYIDTDIYHIDVIKLSDYYIPGHGLLHPDDFSYLGFFMPSPIGTFANIFTNELARIKFLEGRLLLANDYITELQDKIEINVPLTQISSTTSNTYDINITDIDNLTGFTSNIFNYGNDYVLVRYRRGIYIPRNTNRFKYRISVDDNALVLLSKADKLEYKEHNNVNTGTNIFSQEGNNIVYEIPVEENQYYILTVIAYEYNSWQHLAFRPVI